MTTFINANQDIYFNGIHTESWDTRAELNTDNEVQDSTTLTDSTRVFTSGLNNVKLQIDGFEDYAALAHDVSFNMVDGARENVIISLCPRGALVGNPSYSVQVSFAEYNKQNTIGEMAKFTIKAEQSGSIWFRGTVLEADRSISGSGNGTAVQLGAVGATQKMYSALHVTNAGTNLAVLIKNSATAGGAYTTRITHTTTSAIGAEMKESASSLSDTWWRVDWTLGAGDAVFTVCLGIK